MIILFDFISPSKNLSYEGHSFMQYISFLGKKWIFFFFFFFLFWLFVLILVVFSLCFGQISPLAFSWWLTTTPSFSFLNFGIGWWQQFILSSQKYFYKAIQNGAKSECSRVKQMPVIRFLLAETCKQYEIYRRMYNDVYRETRSGPKTFTNRLNIGLPP